MQANSLLGAPPDRSTDPTAAAAATIHEGTTTITVTTTTTPELGRTRSYRQFCQLPSP